jgi:hypothetical protein
VAAGTRLEVIAETEPLLQVRLTDGRSLWLARTVAGAVPAPDAAPPILANSPGTAPGSEPGGLPVAADASSQLASPPDPPLTGESLSDPAGDPAG